MTARVMIVEDELLVAWDLVMTLEEAGFTILGPCTDLDSGFELIKSERPDCAVLDVQVRDREVVPLAEELDRMGVPIVFHSGHARESSLADRFQDAIFCHKPCAPATLIQRVRDKLG